MKYLKEEYQNRIPYHAKMISDGIILNANESPFPLPKTIMDEFIKQLSQINLNRYPDTDVTILNEAISKKYNIKPENVTCGVGSDSLIDCIMKATINKNDLILTVFPTFSMYKQYAELYGGIIYEVPLNDDFSYNIDLIINEIKKTNPKLVVLCNPNNPTGSSMSLKDIKKIISSTNSLIILDEAYIEFYDEKESGINLFIDNLIVLRTFSKAYGFAGGRIGYGISTKENIKMIDTIKSPYFINSMTMLLATLIIKNNDLFNERIDYIIRERKRLYQEYLSLNIEIYQSKANFLWMKLNDEIENKIDDNKIYIRKFNINNKKYCRISIGTVEENNKLLEVISSCVKH